MVIVVTFLRWAAHARTSLLRGSLGATSSSPLLLSNTVPARPCAAENSLGTTSSSPLTTSPASFREGQARPREEATIARPRPSMLQLCVSWSRSGPAPNGAARCAFGVAKSSALRAVPSKNASKATGVARCWCQSNIRHVRLRPDDRHERVARRPATCRAIGQTRQCSMESPPPQPHAQSPSTPSVLDPRRRKVTTPRRMVRSIAAASHGGTRSSKVCNHLAQESWEMPALHPGAPLPLQPPRRRCSKSLA